MRRCSIFLCAILLLSAGLCPASFQKDAGDFARELVQAVGGSAGVYDRALSANELREAHLLGAYATEAAESYKRENGLSYFKSTDAEYADRFAGIEAWRGTYNDIGAGLAGAPIADAYDEHSKSIARFMDYYSAAGVGEAGGVITISGDMDEYEKIISNSSFNGAVEAFKGLAGLFDLDTWKALKNPFIALNYGLNEVNGEFDDALFNTAIYGLQGDYKGAAFHVTDTGSNAAGGLLTSVGIGKVIGKVVQGAKAAAAAKLTKATPKTSGSGSGFAQASRRWTALDGYEGSGITGSDLESHLRAIDFNKPVTIQTLNPGATVVQWQKPERPLGRYFTDPGAPPNRLGFDTAGRMPITYTTSQPVKVLRSTAADIPDWEGSGKIFKGGATQYFTPNPTLFKPLP